MNPRPKVEINKYKFVGCSIKNRSITKERKKVIIAETKETAQTKRIGPKFCKANLSM